MASTGLLGINPYQKGINLDITSKPLQFAIQLQQKEEAKREALDKYFMDYEKTLNSAGMRGQDQDYFLNKLGEAKQYYLQNRDKILNPAKYGADAQSEYMSRLKGAQSAISQSKQEAANEKVDREHWYDAQQKGLDTPDGYLDAVAKSHLPLNHPQHQSLDPYQWNFTKPFDEGAYTKILTAGLTPSIVKQIQEPDKQGYLNRKITYAYTPDDKKIMASRGELSYGNIPGVTNMTNKLIKSGEFINYQNQFNELYPGQDITKAAPKQIAAAVGLSLTPHGKTIEDQVPDIAFKNEAELERQKNLARFTVGLKDKQDQTAAANLVNSYLKKAITTEPVVKQPTGIFGLGIKPATSKFDGLTKLNLGPDIAEKFKEYKEVPINDIEARKKNPKTKRETLIPRFANDNNGNYFKYYTKNVDGQEIPDENTVSQVNPDDIHMSIIGTKYPTPFKVKVGSSLQAKKEGNKFNNLPVGGKF